MLRQAKQFLQDGANTSPLPIDGTLTEMELKRDYHRKYTTGHPEVFSVSLYRHNTSMKWAMWFSICGDCFVVYTSDWWYILRVWGEMSEGFVAALTEQFVLGDTPF